MSTGASSKASKKAARRLAEFGRFLLWREQSIEI
jgi:hypothetical protein